MIRRDTLSLAVALVAVAFAVAQPVGAGSSGGGGGSADLDNAAEQLKWLTSLGAIVHVEGPSDQNLVLRPGSARTLALQEDGGAAALTVETSGNVTLASSLLFTAASPAQLTADQNDYNPSALGYWRLTSDALRTITGIAGGVDGRLLIIVNVGSNGITFAHQSASSAAANRIIAGTLVDFTLSADDTALFIYDGTTQRWRQLTQN